MAAPHRRRDEPGQVGGQRGRTGAAGRLRRLRRPPRRPRPPADRPGRPRPHNRPGRQGPGGRPQLPRQAQLSANPIPVRLHIPKIQLTTSLEPLGRAPDGTVQVPNRPDLAGWYAPGLRPGNPGSAVILGHVDDRHAPAVFYRLRELRAGDQLTVTRADGSAVRFVVQRTRRYDKQQFPTDEVYYPTLRSTLRLITCGGQFDPTTGHYRSNIVVFATTKS